MNEMIESHSEFRNTPTGQWRRWFKEMEASDKASKKFRKQANDTVSEYLNQRNKDAGFCFKLNLFHSNITTVEAMMFGKLPEVSFSRRNEDANDDTARVVGDIYQRMLNADIGTPDDQYSQSLRGNLQDRLLAGLGLSRVRYTYDEEQVTVAAVEGINGEVVQEEYTETRISNERAPIEYVHWRDFRWKPARIWKDVTWIAFRTWPTFDQLKRRFGEKVAKQIPLQDVRDTKEEETLKGDDPHLDAHMRGEIWEIWDKQNRKVIWWSPGYDKILDERDDPLKLRGFFPIPEPMVSNTTTSAFMPIPDYILAQDLYNEVDQLETRIATITEAVKVVGLYDSSADGVKRLFTEGMENDLIPVDNWAMFAEKGGLKGTIDWLPIEEISNVLNKLVELRNDAKALLYEVTGIADIMRGGQQAGGAVTATERALEARFASVRIQALQDSFAKYATDLIRLRAEVVSKHFQPATIIEQSGILYSFNADQAAQAVQAMKKDESLIWRIEVKPESVAMVDYAQLKAERTDYITALATFMQSAAPLVEMDPKATPVLLGLLKWGMAGFKGSQDVESVLDRAIQQVEQTLSQPQEQNQPPSPEQIKSQMEQQRQQFQMQLKQMEQQFEREKWRYEQEMKRMEHQQKLQEIAAASQADLTQEKAQAQYNITEEQIRTDETIKRDQARMELEAEYGTASEG